jgi:hypothetical protein
MKKKKNNLTIFFLIITKKTSLPLKQAKPNKPSQVIEG